jgi:NAD(P)-dependent dehydrogenase (short-subunit alcohol dehydrogenase family)
VASRLDRPRSRRIGERQGAAEKYGAKAIAIEADVSDSNAVQRAADRIESELGPVDVWVNNAMVTIYSGGIDVAPDEFEQMTRVSFLGRYGTCGRANRGVIIFIGSALAYRSIPYQAPYCAAKAAVRVFVDSLRSELLYEKSNVR